MDINALPAVEPPSFLSSGFYFEPYMLVILVSLSILFFFGKRIKVIFYLCVIFLKSKNKEISDKNLISQIERVIPSVFYTRLSASDTDKITHIKYSNKALSNSDFVQKLLIKTLILCFSGVKS